MWDFCSKTWLRFWNVKSGGQRFAEVSPCVSRAWGGPSGFGDASGNFILTDRSTPCHSSDAHCPASVRSPHINLPDSRDQKMFSEFCLHPSVVPRWGKKSRSGLTSAATDWTVSPDWHSSEVKALTPHVAVWEPFRRWGRLNEPWAWSPDPTALVPCRKRGSLSAPYTDIVKRRRLHPRRTAPGAEFAGVSGVQGISSSCSVGWPSRLRPQQPQSFLSVSLGRPLVCTGEGRFFPLSAAALYSS